MTHTPVVKGGRCRAAGTWLIPILLFASSTLTACGGDGPQGPGPSPYERDDELRLNHVQAKGTHNSYHQEPDRPADEETCEALRQPFETRPESGLLIPIPSVQTTLGSPPPP